MHEVNKLDSLEVPQPDVRQELMLNNMQFHKTQAAAFLKKSDDMRKEIAETYLPKEIELGKTYIGIRHPNDTASIFEHAPAMYTKLLKDNKLCLHYQNSEFENREVTPIAIALYDLNFNLGIIRWEITVENSDQKLFTALYATKMAGKPYPKLKMDDLFILLAISGLQPDNLGDNVIYIAKNVNGAVTTFVNGVPADWVVKGIPFVPEGVKSWPEFMTNPESILMNLDDKVFSLDEWLSYCNAT